MAIPLTGPISLGGLKNDTNAATASFSDPKIRRRFVTSDGFTYGDQLPANTQMSLRDFRGSILTLERDFAGAQADLDRNPEIGLQTMQLGTDPWGVYGGSTIDEFNSNPKYRRLQVRATSNYDADVAVAMVSGAYVSPSLLPASANISVWDYGNDDMTQRTILAVNCYTSGLLSGSELQPVWVDPVAEEMQNVNFTIPAGYPYVVVFFLQVVRRSWGTEKCYLIADRGTSTNQKFIVMQVKLT